MRNLRQIHQFHIAADVLGPDARISAGAWDVGTDSFVCAYTVLNETLVRLARIDYKGDVRDITSWEPETPNDTIQNIHHLADSACTCLIFSSGNLVLVNEDPHPVVEIVGCIDAGISAASWSPDEEVLAITTNAPSLLLMTREIEPIEEVFFSEEDLKASKHVSVGWGKAETQFKGKHAKAMRDPTVAEKVDQGLISKEDDRSVVISWRGDGEYLAVSSVEKTEDKRAIRCFTREGRLDSVSQPVDGLEAPICWRPSGSLIAGIQRSDQSLETVFFERNGLRHGEFKLDTSSSLDTKVYGLHWNCDSNVLAIVLEDKIQLWSVGNYHWYLKQELPVNRTSDRKTAVNWHPEQPLKCFISNGALIDIHEFTWAVSGGSMAPPHDYGLVSVTDGRNVNITPLRIANVPPPMSYLQIAVNTTPTDTAFNSEGSKLAILLEGGVDLATWSYGKKHALSTPVITRVISLASDVKFRQITFLGGDRLALLGEDTSNCTVLRLLSMDGFGKVESDELLPITSETAIVTVGPASHGDDILLQDTFGKICRYDVTSKTQSQVGDLGFRCPTTQVSEINGNAIVFGLSDNGKLSADGRILSTSCSSFAVVQRFLIFTTNQHVIKFIHLTEHAQDLQIPGDDSTADERCRNIERGSKLITVMPTKFSLVMQMPRGNLETIYPRALVLEGIRNSIRSGNYKTAFLACRDHRVDMNILYDYAPSQFMGSIGKFFQQLKKAEYIDLFISQLRDEDVTTTLYAETSMLQEVEDKGSLMTDKVNAVCEAMISHLKKDLSGTNVQNIITAYVCKSPPDLESAISLIATLKGSDQYDQAITHISFLSDVNKLYDTALGIYNLEMALMLAQQAQKDPREYLPFLQSLQEMSELRRQYTIDDRLGRTAKALNSLHAMGDECFEEATKYIQRHNLYTQAFGLYKYQPNDLKVLTKTYADYLVDNSQFKEAAFAYEWLGDTASAMEFYRKAGLWQECLFIATSMEQDVGDLATELASVLIEAKEYCTAARIHLDYRLDIEEGVRLLCKGNAFSEAMRITRLHKKPELLENVVDPELQQSFGSTSELLADCKGQLTAQTTRIAELREKKKSDPLAFLDGATEADVPDDVSLAPTMATTSHSLYTRYTGATNATALTGASRKTSKNRRKEERKRARGKKGSVYEEEYLMNSIRRLNERVEIVSTDAQRLVECLYRRGMRSEAAAVQEQLKELVEQLKTAVAVVFSDAPQTAAQADLNSGMEGGGGGEIMPAANLERPVIKVFTGLPLF